MNDTGFKLRTKILTVIAIVWGLMLIVCYFESNRLIKTYITLENKLAKDDVKRVENALEKIEIAVSTQVANWSVWDDGYQFMVDKSPTFIKNNLTAPGILPTQADAMLIYDVSGKPFFQISLNKERTAEGPPDKVLEDALQPNQALWNIIEKPGVDTAHYGLFYTDEGLLILASHGIVRSNGKGPAHGTWIFVKRINKAVIDELKDATKLNFVMVTLPDIKKDPFLMKEYDYALKNGGNSVQKISGKTMNAFGLLKDINGKPLGMLQVFLPRTVYASGLDTIYYFNIVLIASGLLFAILLFFMLKKMIIDKIERINKKVIQVRETHDFSTHIPDQGADELASVGAEANKMLRIIKIYDEQNKKILNDISAELEQSNILSEKLKLSEAFLKDIINSMPSMLIIVNEQKQILQINNAAREEAELDRDEDLAETALFVYFPWLQDWREQMDSVMQHDKPETLDKIMVKSGKGNRYFNVLMFPLSSGKMLSIRLDEITHIVKLQEKMLQNDKLASIGVLTAGVMHEINNPVNFVLSAISPLKNDLHDMQQVFHQYEKLDTSENAEEGLRQTQIFANDLDIMYTIQEVMQLMVGIKDGIDRTHTIIKDLESASEHDERVIKRVNIHEGIDSTLTILTHRIKGNINIIKQYDTSLPEIECYPARLNQVFVNIITNAVDAIMDKGDITITTSRKDERHIQISFKDNGTGISKANIDKIFDPFFTTKEVGKGTGLGLSITRSIIKDIKGNLRVESQEHEGTEFIIVLLINQD